MIDRPPSALPPLPPQPPLPASGPFVIFSRGQWADIGRQFADLAERQEALYDAAELTMQLFGTFTTTLEGLMATIADLTAAVATLTANDAAEAAAFTTLHAAVENLITVFNSVKGGLSPADQTALDAAVAGVTSASTDAATAAASETTLDTDVDTANPPVPAPPVP